MTRLGMGLLVFAATVAFASLAAFVAWLGADPIAATGY